MERIRADRGTLRKSPTSSCTDPMPSSPPAPKDRRLIKQLPLQLVLIGPFVAQIFAAVSIVGYLSFKNGQDAINKVASQVRTEVSDRIEQKLDNYLITLSKSMIQNK
jgi:hypothetical protein